jgi:hypothetical protein
MSARGWYYWIISMRAHRVRVRISDDHELRLKLPSDFPPGDAEVIVLEAEGQESLRGGKQTIDDLIASRLPRPSGVDPVTLDDMERAISEGATGRGSS